MWKQQKGVNNVTHTGADFEGSFLYAVWYSSKYLQKRERRAQPDELLSEIIRRIRSIEPMDAESMDAEPMEIVDWEPYI